MGLLVSASGGQLCSAICGLAIFTGACTHSLGEPNSIPPGPTTVSVIDGWTNERVVGPDIDE